ncbi:GNAT family protein [Paenibacillus polymyxa]|uniref:GNAT family N-acetyltransferase n=1 Tax=Paenibacillus polymyxa TaxID=1406 RepID=UPI00307EA49A
MCAYACKGHIPLLESPRLRLRRMESRDAATMFACWSDPEVHRYMNLSGMSGREDAENMIGLLNELAKTEDALRWGIELKDNGKLIGSCGFNYWQTEGAYKAEIGYELAKPYWRQGYMTEALRLVLSFGYGTIRLNRIEALVDPRNTGSQALLSSMGWTQEGLLRQVQHTSTGFKDMLMYSLLHEEWLRLEVQRNAVSV